MLNQAILNEQIRTFGIEATEKFCKMEAHKYQLIAQSHPNGSDEAREALHNRDWWETSADSLMFRINKLTNKY